MHDRYSTAAALLRILRRRTKLVGLLQAAGGIDIQIYTNDRANPCAPPYDQPIHRATFAAEKAWGALMESDSAERRMHEQWARQAGLPQDTIARGFAMEAKVRAVRRAQVEAGTWHNGGGFIHYIAWARRP